MNSETNHAPSVFIRMVSVVLILGVGIGGFIGLKKLKKPPQQTQIDEHALAVEVLKVEPQSRFALLKGYGEIQPRTEVPLSAEVAGKILTAHERLEVGTVISEGAVLFTIDEQDYRLSYDTAVARLKVLNRDHGLASGELQRVSRLYRDNKVGTLSTVEQAEKAVNGIANQMRQVEQDRDLAALRLSRCTIRAPFNCRVTEMDVEKDEYVTVGKKLLTLVNDGDLELQVALDSREAMQWLRLEPKSNPTTANWFSVPEPVECIIIWSEHRDVKGTGHLDRIVRFDSKTRTLVVSISLNGDAFSTFPLAAGMFCQVEIPGKVMESVFVLPRQAVSYENTVYVVRDGRLHTTAVEVIRLQGETTLVKGGLEPGDMVITTRLENPLEKMLVEVKAAATKQ